MSKINFEKEINAIISQQKIFEEKLDVIVRDFKKYLASPKPVNENDLQLENKQKKKVKFVYNYKH
jgi:hypothetical protein